MRLIWIAGVLVCAVACANPFWRDSASTIEVDSPLPASDPTVASAERLAQVFYDRISNRRFNSIATFQDPGLHEFFRAEESFADYFADLVQALTDARFEKNRIVEVTIDDVSVNAAGRARVRVRFVGENADPLRPWNVRLVREDRWERSEGRWWIVPGKL